MKTNVNIVLSVILIYVLTQKKYPLVFTETILKQCENKHNYETTDKLVQKVVHIFPQNKEFLFRDGQMLKFVLAPTGSDVTIYKPAIVENNPVELRSLKRNVSFIDGST